MISTPTELAPWDLPDRPPDKRIARTAEFPAGAPAGFESASRRRRLMPSLFKRVFVQNLGLKVSSLLLAVGLWLVYQVCDRVDLHSDRDGTVIRMHMSLR